jgi:hypothetical protein
MNINHRLLPQRTIALKDLDRPIELKHLLQGFGRGCYEFFVIPPSHVNLARFTIKYGMTCEADGERVYRQSWRFQGWTWLPGEESAGSDLDSTIAELEQQHPWLTKEQVYLHIWDMTQFPAANHLRPEHEPYQLEGQLILEHAELYGHCPPGNKKEQRRLKQGLTIRPLRSVAPDALIDRLFDTDQ